MIKKLRKWFSQTYLAVSTLEKIEVTLIESAEKQKRIYNILCTIADRLDNIAKNNPSNGIERIRRELLPAAGELGWEDPRLPASLFKAMCIEAQRDSLKIINDYMSNAVCELDHRKFLLDALSQAPNSGQCLEFGVYSGTTITWLAEANQEKIFYGFDSFEGLPSLWSGYKTFDFNLSGTTPKVPDNVILIKGTFDNTVPEFAKEKPQISFIHIDCDLYTSTKTILDELGDMIIPGAIIVFDEYFNYPGFTAHEFRAFSEFISQSKRDYVWISYCGERAAVQIL
jgi:predicted O-methyltransferase YrrM